jgi:hypothetical protein
METAAMVTDSLESRIDLSEQLVHRHGKLIRDTRYEAAHRLADLEKQISRLKRLVGFLTELLLGLISACLAFAATAFVGGAFSWGEAVGSAVLAFFIAMWIANFVFRRAAGRLW